MYNTLWYLGILHISVAQMDAMMSLGRRLKNEIIPDYSRRYRTMIDSHGRGVSQLSRQWKYVISSGSNFSSGVTPQTAPLSLPSSFKEAIFPLPC